MRDLITYKLLHKLLVLGGLSLCLWAVSARTKSQQEDQFIPVVITDQLPAKDGVIPVYLYCGQARLSSPNRLEEFQCTLRNNTNQSITAANAIYSIVLDQNGSSIKDTVNSTVEALVHPDFRGTSKLIGPGEESAVGPPGPISYANGGVVKGVEISIDYVEFENGTSLGSDKEGSRIIRAMRAGAEKYRKWFQLRYNLQGRSVASVASDLETDQSLPGDLQLADPNEEQGAIAYRRRLQKLLQTRGAGEIKKLLDSKQ
jgi:hypothetical protein